MEISTQYKNNVLVALSATRNQFSGSDTAYAKSLGINGSVYNRIKNGENTEGLLSAAKWISLGRQLDVQLHNKTWVTAKTAVYRKIEKDMLSCKNNSTALVLVDECGIGKTYSARQIAKTMQNVFYVDCSQAKTKQAFIRLIAKTVGVDSLGKYSEVKKDLKYALMNIIRPLIVLDEAGDLEYTAFLELKELWNATEKICGWYMMGADGLRAKIRRGIDNKKVGYREIFDRFNNKYMSAVPAGKGAKKEFYSIMISEVLMANLPENKHHQINEFIPLILGTDSDDLGSLRRAETFINLSKKEYESTDAR